MKTTTRPREGIFCLGVDGGTGGIRCQLFNAFTGESLHTCERTYETTYGIPRAGCATQTCADWWQSFRDAVRELLSVSKISLADIAAVCLDTTCCSVVFMEENGESAIYPCVMWCDMRAGMKETKDVLNAAECAKRRRKRNEDVDDVDEDDDARYEEEVAKTLRVNCDGEGPVSAEWMVPKALWMKRNEREVYDRATKVCEYQDYMNFRLTKRYCAANKRA